MKSNRFEPRWKPSVPPPFRPLLPDSPALQDFAGGKWKPLFGPCGWPEIAIAESNTLPDTLRKNRDTDMEEKKMDPRQLFTDERFQGRCVYCGCIPDPRDHVPSKVLLDDPLPVTCLLLKRVRRCNGAFSLDEEYLACFLECVIIGLTDTALLTREKIVKILTRKVELAVSGVIAPPR
jgi:hypothetical protein